MATIFGVCCLCALSVASLKVLTIWLASAGVVWLLLQEEEKADGYEALVAHCASCAVVLFLLLVEVGISLNSVKNADSLNV